MRVAHFDCFSGADMLLGGFVDAGVEIRAIGSGISSLDVPVTLSVENAKRTGLAATHIKVTTQ